MTVPTQRWLKWGRGRSELIRASLIALVASAAFFALATEVSKGHTMAFDRMLIEGLRQTTDAENPARAPWLRRIMVDLTALGGGPLLTIITATVVAYLLVVRKWKTAAFLTVAIAGGGAANEFLKSLFLRARPDLVAHLADSYSTSFPSGHAMNSALTYLTLAALLARTQKDHHVRVFYMLVAIALTLAIGFSRVYLGVHWPTDVIAGWCVGVAWALIFAVLAQAFQRRDQIERPSTSTDV